GDIVLKFIEKSAGQQIISLEFYTGFGGFVIINPAAASLLGEKSDADELLGDLALHRAASLRLILRRQRVDEGLKLASRHFLIAEGKNDFVVRDFGSGPGRGSRRRGGLDFTGFWNGRGLGILPGGFGTLPGGFRLGRGFRFW
ncbi:MAG: hypothetical protein ACRD7E_16065, partial [Bryobacteraceae bacterium]